MNNLERIKSASRIFLESSSYAQKLKELRTLVGGVDRRLDNLLTRFAETLDKLQKLQEGQLAEVAVEQLPERTPEEKKRKEKALFWLRTWRQFERGEVSEAGVQLLPEETAEEKERKRLLLLLIRTWKDLQGEIHRLQVEWENLKSDDHPSAQKKATTVRRVVSLAKGPLGLITVAAAGLVLASNYLNSVAREVVVVNQNCETIQPKVRMPISLPGITFPKEPIPPGGQSVLRLPPLNLVVDYQSNQKIKLSAYGISIEIQAGGTNVDPIFNGESLSGKVTELRLSERKTHELVLRCQL